MSDDYTSVDLSPPQLEPKPAFTVAGVQNRYEMKGFDFDEFPRQISAMRDQLGQLSGRVGDRTYDVFWGMFHDQGGTFDYLVGVEVGLGAQLPNGFTALELPAQPYVVVANAADDSPRDTIFTLWNEWLPASSYVHAANQPEFLYEHADDYDETRNNGPVDIWVPVK